jgi:hypothetical protein
VIIPQEAVVCAAAIRPEQRPGGQGSAATSTSTAGW